MIHKLKAFAAHIGISLVIFIGVLSFIIYFWYPQPFFTSDGGWQGIRIIAAVDLVLGPLLTFIVYKPNKPGLKVDLTIIGIVQAAALSWGIWIVHFERPIAAVYAEGAISTVTANDMEARGMTNEKLKAFGEHTPVWIYSNLPEDFAELQKLRLDALQAGKRLHLLPEYYVAIDETIRKKLSENSFNMEAWLKDKPNDKKIYDKFVQRYGTKKMSSIFFLPWYARYDRNIIVLRKADLSYVATLSIQPPEAHKDKPEYWHSTSEKVKE